MLKGAANTATEKLKQIQPRTLTRVLVSWNARRMIRMIIPNPQTLSPRNCVKEEICKQSLINDSPTGHRRSETIYIIYTLDLWSAQMIKITRYSVIINNPREFITRMTIESEGLSTAQKIHSNALKIDTTYGTDENPSVDFFLNIPTNVLIGERNTMKEMMLPKIANMKTQGCRGSRPTIVTTTHNTTAVVIGEDGQISSGHTHTLSHTWLKKREEMVRLVWVSIYKQIDRSQWRSINSMIDNTGLGYRSN